MNCKLEFWVVEILSYVRPNTRSRLKYHGDRILVHVKSLTFSCSLLICYRSHDSTPW